MQITRKPVTAEKVMDWILRNTKVSEIEEMSITLVGFGDKQYGEIHILGSKVEEFRRRERYRRVRTSAT